MIATRFVQVQVQDCLAWPLMALYSTLENILTVAFATPNKDSWLIAEISGELFMIVLILDNGSKQVPISESAAIIVEVKMSLSKIYVHI